MNGHLEGEQPYLGDLLAMASNHALTNWDDPPSSPPNIPASEIWV